MQEVELSSGVYYVGQPGDKPGEVYYDKPLQPVDEEALEIQGGNVRHVVINGSLEKPGTDVRASGSVVVSGKVSEGVRIEAPTVIARYVEPGAHIFACNNFKTTSGREVAKEAARSKMIQAEIGNLADHLNPHLKKISRASDQRS